MQKKKPLKTISQKKYIDWKKIELYKVRSSALSKFSQYKVFSVSEKTA